MRIYTVTFKAVAITGVVDLFNLKPAADIPIKLHGFELSNVGGTADAGDTQEELLRVEVMRYPATVTDGSGGSTPTPRPLLPNDVAASFVARTNDTTPATTSGTVADIHATGMNVRVNTPYIYTPELRPVAAANTTRLIVKLNLAPNDSINISGTAWVEELA